MSKSIASCGAIILLPCALLAQPDRITAPIDAGRTVVLRGNVHPKAQPRFDQGPVEPAFRIGYVTLMLKKTAAQQAALEELLEEQQNPASPNYHDWLTPEQYADRFGVSQHDLDSISAWLQSEGFIVEYTARGRNWLAFSGTARQVQAAFLTEIHRYRVDGEMHFAAVAEPSIPVPLEPVVAGILGLDDFNPKALGRQLPGFTWGWGTNSLAPGDLATIYDIGKLYQAGFDGTGQRMVVVGQSSVGTSDIQGFRGQFKLPAISLQAVAYSGEPGFTGDAAETLMDLEWAGAVARNALLIYVYGYNADSAAIYAIDNNLAPVIAESFGDCEAQRASLLSSYRSEAQKASAQGITWLAASGDAGAADCDNTGNTAIHGLAVNFPASIPEVTAVGGTEFNDGTGAYWNSYSSNGGTALSYIPEVVWNDTGLDIAAGYGLSASGGGASSFYPKPAWQTGPGVPNDGARDLPDISLDASNDHDPYSALIGGIWMGCGGTSVSTQAFAGIVTLLNQYLVSKGIQSKPGVGNINPTLYRLAQSARPAFHDVTVGNNFVPCTQGTPNCAMGQLGYNAGPGYDLATGLGSVDAYNLVTQWNSIASTITTVTANPSSITSSGGTTLTATVTASSGSTTPTGSVSFTLGGTLLGAANLSGSGAMATASLSVSGNSLTAGNNTITASYGGSSSFGASSGSVTVTVTVPAVATTTTVTANPTSITVGGSTTLTATVKASNGGSIPTGSVSFTLGSTLLGAANLSGSSGMASASLNVSGSWLTAGIYTITASYGGSGSFGASSGSVMVTVAVPVVATTTTVTASPTSITVGGSTTLTATVTAGSGSTTPTGSVSFTLGGTLLGAANLSGSSGMATASLNVPGNSLTAGDNRITASYGGSSSFGASSGSVTVSVPLPSIKSVTNAASYATGAVSPGEMVTIFGTAIGPATAAGATTDPATGKLATTIGGVQVLFNGVAAPLVYASGTQVSALVPYEVAPVASPSVWVKYMGLTSNVFQLTSVATAPGLFTQNASGSGPGSILNQDNSVNGPGNPAAKGSIVQVYLTGEGQTSPYGVTGTITAATLPPPQVTPAPILAIGVTVNGASVLYVYAGEAPGLVAGMMQLNMQIPADAPSGDLPILVSIGGSTSQSNVTVSVR